VTGPLAGVRIVDFGQVIAGPYGPAVLSDAGADLIKVENLEGEFTRSPSAGFLGLNRGKRAIAVNLRSDGGREVGRRLAAWADVFSENFRPGVMKRIGLDYETVSALNPRLIFASVSAFGSDGPYSHRPGFDPLLQAMTGVERAQGGRANPPVFLRIAVTDYATALSQAAAISLALYQRERTGRGQLIETSLLRSGIFINGDAFTRYPGRPERVLPDAGQHGLGPLDRMYRTRDGWLFLLVEDDEERWRRLGGDSRFVALAADARFATAADRADHAEALASALAAVFAAETTEAWLTALAARDVPAAPVIEGYERLFFEDVQPIINGYLLTSRHPERGRMEQNGRFIAYSLSQASPETRAAPLLGQHTDEILAELGFRAAEIAALRAADAVR
jgi:crotonobetainyl-CoA:carnitine CoA-transferase CaiB-like acyl-CoA transferase